MKEHGIVINRCLYLVCLLQKWLQLLISPCVHVLCDMTLDLLTLRDRVCFSIWASGLALSLL